MQTHSIPLAHPDSFGVVVSPRNSKMQVVIPAELCIVCEDQFYQRRLTEALTSKALELSKKKPYERQRYICGMDYRDKKMDLQTPVRRRDNISNTATDLASLAILVQGVSVHLGGRHVDIFPNGGS